MFPGLARGCGRCSTGVRPPATARVVAVGGSATSLRRIAGPVLDADAFARTLALLAGARAAELARRFALDEDRAGSCRPAC